MRNGLLDYHGSCQKSPRASLTNPSRQVYAQGFGRGSAGLGGTAFQLVVIIFVELFGVSLGQFVASITPSVQVGILFDPFIMVVLTTFCSCPFGFLSIASG
jgi:ATP-binding cassette, subfamily G (WHITE), member 2, SNQ2